LPVSIRSPIDWLFAKIPSRYLWHSRHRIENIGAIEHHAHTHTPLQSTQPSIPPALTRWPAASCSSADGKGGPLYRQQIGGLCSIRVFSTICSSERSLKRHPLPPLLLAFASVIRAHTWRRPLPAPAAGGGGPAGRSLRHGLAVGSWNSTSPPAGRYSPIPHRAAFAGSCKSSAGRHHLTFEQSPAECSICRAACFFFGAKEVPKAAVKETAPHRGGRVETLHRPWPGPWIGAPTPARSRATQFPRYTSLTTFFCFPTLLEPRTKAGSFPGNDVGTGDPTGAKMQHPSRARDGLHLASS
jgi:hypothetical protein